MFTEHGTRFDNDCNTCICHYGDSVCTKYHCDYSSENGEAVIWSCPLQAELVCTASGKRYINSCFSQLANEPDVVQVSCQRGSEYGGGGSDDEQFDPECYTVIKLIYSIKQVNELLLEIC